MTKDVLIELAKEAMSNADLIEQAREAIDNLDDFARMANVVATGPLLVLNSAIDKLELADKRIAEEREQHDIMMERGAEKLAEAERKLAVAREALGIATTYSMLESNRKIITEALAQIGGEDARSRYPRT